MGTNREMVITAHGVFPLDLFVKNACVCTLFAHSLAVNLKHNRFKQVLIAPLFLNV